MDVNGTRFHLIASEGDWQAVLDTTPSGRSSAWHDGSASVILRPDLPLFPRGRQAGRLSLDSRRGAACDRFGTWYWIGHDRQTIWRAPAATTRAVLYWQQSEPPVAAPRGAFVAQAPPPLPADLGGLTVTAHHYLLVGILRPAGLLIFDLHAGGEPARLQFPAGTDFEPFDLAPAADGGAWVLDHKNRRLWGVDRFFRLLPLSQPIAAEPEPGSFAPENSPEPAAGMPVARPPQGLLLPAPAPVALEVLPDGSLLTLHEAAAGASSTLYHLRLGATPGTLLPPVEVKLPDLSQITPGDARPVVGHDLALTPDGKRVLVLEQDGNQAIAYELRPDRSAGSGLALIPQDTYLPLHYFGGRALASGLAPDGQQAVYYDVTPVSGNDQSVRWVRLHAIDLPRYERLAWRETPPLDSHQRGTTWHRLFLDACIPPETEVAVWTRSADDRDLLAQQVFVEEPGLYLRGRGAEIPYWRAWPPREDESPVPTGVGTWEVLFQQAHGRWLQVRLVLSGNGRATPQLHRLRVYYPRFSYSRNYLPAAYAEDLSSAGFLERFLANMEGFYSELEGKIAGASALLDPRSAPAETLDWLAAWMGLVLDPLWSKIGEAHKDRRRLMIRFARRLYERRGTVDGLRFALLLLLDPCLEDALRRLEWAAVTPNVALRQELEELGLPYPSLADGEAALEDLLFHYVLAAPGRSRVRIVERWQARQGMALQSGDMTAGEETGSQSQSLADAINEAAHRFSVLVPEDLPAHEAAMVDKIVRLEKPAHTVYDMRRFWDYFLVGQVRLGIDTVLGEDSRFLPIILGRDALSEGYLENAHPMNVVERTVSDRDRLGRMAL